MENLLAIAETKNNHFLYTMQSVVDDGILVQIPEDIENNLACPGCNDKKNEAFPLFWPHRNAVIKLVLVRFGEFGFNSDNLHEPTCQSTQITDSSVLGDRRK